jgi:hypothetical protein
MAERYTQVPRATLWLVQGDDFVMGNAGDASQISCSSAASVVVVAMVAIVSVIVTIVFIVAVPVVLSHGDSCRERQR